MSKESKIAGVLLAGVTALLVAFFTPVGDWIARQFLPDEKKAQATAERLRDLVGNEFTVRGIPACDWPEQVGPRGRLAVSPSMAYSHAVWFVETSVFSLGPISSSY